MHKQTLTLRILGNTTKKSVAYRFFYRYGPLLRIVTASSRPRFVTVFGAT